MAIKPIDFYNQLVSKGVAFFSGVPDSLLKEFCLCIDDFVLGNNHIIAANEGNAVSLAAGYYLANKSIPVVYMQNSGLGNAINPLLSLCDPDVYSIPMLVMIGWRGEPNVKDEPQHIKQGKVQIELLNAMDIPFEILSKEDKIFEPKVSKLLKIAKGEKKPVALLIKKGTFENYGIKKYSTDIYPMKREEALGIIIDNLEENIIIVSTTGKTSREIFEIREKKGQTHNQDFLTVGSMGHCSSIALGIALSKPDRKVVCIDGDGALLMHMGSLTSIATLKPKNFNHILINNEVHESVGGQPTAAKNLDLSAIIKAIGVKNIFKAQTSVDLKNSISKLLDCSGPSFLEVKVQPGSRKDLGRPTINPADNKKSFMKYLEK